MFFSFQSSNTRGVLLGYWDIQCCALDIALNKLKLNVINECTVSLSPSRVRRTWEFKAGHIVPFYIRFLKPTCIALAGEDLKHSQLPWAALCNWLSENLKVHFTRNQSKKEMLRVSSWNLTNLSRGFCRSSCQSLVSFQKFPRLFLYLFLCEWNCFISLTLKIFYFLIKFVL